MSAAPPGAGLLLGLVVGVACGIAGGLVLSAPADGRSVDAALHASPHARHAAGRQLVALVRFRPVLGRWRAPRVPRVRRPAPRIIHLPPRIVTVVVPRTRTAPRSVSPPPRHREHEAEHEHGGGDD